MNPVITFTYDGRKRVAIELGPQPEKGGILHYQLKKDGQWARGKRCFKPGKRMDVQQLGFVKSLYYTLSSGRFEIG